MNKRLQIALLSGGFALAGVALAQLLALLQKRTSNHRHREIFLRQKRGEIGDHLITAVLRLGELIHADNLEDIHALSRNASAERVHLLCRLYFPSLVDHACRFLDAGAGISQALLASYDPLDERTCGAQAADSRTFKEARSELIQARDALIEAIQTEPASYAKA